MNPTQLPTSAKIASVLALGLGGLELLWFAVEPGLGLLSCVVLLLGGWGIRKGRVWSAYGLGSLQAAGACAVLSMLGREHMFSVRPELVITGIWALFFAAICFKAGAALSSVGGERGRPIPWLAASAAILLLPIALLFVRPFVIPTGSMEETLLVGDRILVRTFPKPEATRGRIVAYRSPYDSSQIFMGRVVAVPGDRVRLVNKQLWLNGSALDEPYAIHKTHYVDAYRDNFPAEPSVQVYPSAIDMLDDHVSGGELVVPEGRFFVLGDNRDYSLDSRYQGLVDANAVIGDAFLIYYSEEHAPASASSDPEFVRVRYERIFKSL